MLTAREAAALLGISVRAFYDISPLVKGRQGSARRWRWPRAEVMSFIEDRYFVDLSAQRAQKLWKIKGAPFPQHEALLTLEQIVANKTKFPYSGPAVYFLFCGDELIYIGQTVNLLARVGSHFGRKDFDHFSYIVCERDQLMALERSAIWKYKPKLNLV